MLDQRQYAPADMIGVTIANGLPTSILAADHQSNCTAVTLERQSGGSWQPQNPCRLMSATHLITFGSGSLTTVSLRPQSAGPTLEWAVGTYHVAVTYSVGRTTGSGTLVLSPSFTIG